MNAIRQVIRRVAVNERDFVGFHCSPHEIRGSYKGLIEQDYAPQWFSQILEALPFRLHDKFEEETGRDRYEAPSKYDEDFDDWARDVEGFLDRHDVEWIFVGDDDPIERFGDWCYRVYLPDSKVMASIADYGVEGPATAYLYNSRRVTPKLVELEE